MIEVRRVYLGYCHQCQQPTLIAEVAVSGWANVINVCADCIAAIAARLRVASQTNGDAK